MSNVEASEVTGGRSAVTIPASDNPGEPCAAHASELGCLAADLPSCASSADARGAGGRASSAAPAVELRDVGFSYGGHRGSHHKPILDRVSLVFPAGEVSAIVGPNGCGKSTTVKLISRALKPQAGQVLVGGDDVASLGRKELARRVAVLAQGGQVPNMQVEQFVMSGRYPHQAFLAGPSEDDRRIVRAAMERAGCDRWAGASMTRLTPALPANIISRHSAAQSTRFICAPP